MSHTRKKFIHRNETFDCLQCGFHNEKHPESCRNHCRKCLYSRHVDDAVPGDRASTCHGLMEPIGIDYSGKKGQMIVHECLTCGKKMKNMVAQDDDLDAIIALGQKPLRQS